MKNRNFAACVRIGSLSVLLVAALTGCALGSRGRQDPEKGPDQSILTIGFAQVGEESDWRRGNSANIKETFSDENGYHLLFVDAQNNPEKQTSAVRNFVQKRVDYIVVEPIVETGWDNVLLEAKEAGIPVIVADRSISVEDESLFAAWIGSDSYAEGEKACAWLHAYAETVGFEESELRIVNIQGTIGSSPQIGREKSLDVYAEKYGWKILGRAEGDFVQAKGREAMAELLDAYPELNVVYCDNDNEAFGAIEALQNAGRKIGRDLHSGEIMIISFDSTARGLQMVRDGLIACDAECNPLHGPGIEKIIEAVEKGEPFEKMQYVEESLYAEDDLISYVSLSDGEFPVTVVTEELIAGRTY